jgi:DNA primase catalytic core
MSELTDWINYELYPSLFDVIPQTLPEHNFRKVSGDWISKTYLDGAPHKTRGNKTVVTKKVPGRILEQGGETLSLVDYVMRRDSVDFLQGVKTLAEVVGLTLPTSSDFDQESYRNHKERATVLEDANSYFLYCLKNSPKAKGVTDYLTSRGYSSEDIEAMELGYIPSQDQLYKYLHETKGHAKELIEESLKLNKAIGDTHSLTIPYRSGGSIKGFKFRTVGDATPKYLNSTGLDRSGGFFNLSGISGDKDVVIVEGELDSLHATVKGLENVVATGGSSVNSEQVKDAIRRGAKSFTICLDREPGKEEETAKRVNSVIEVILGEGVNRVYVVTLDDLGGDKTDPDKLLKEKGVEALIKALNEAKPYYFYWLSETFTKFGKLQEERSLTYRDTDNLLEEVVETSNRIPDPLQRDQYKQLFIDMPGVKGLGVTEESLSITLDRLTSTKSKEDQDRELKKLLSTAKDLQDKGEPDKALELLEQRIKDVKGIAATGLIPPPTSFSTLLNEIAETPPAYKTGYSSLDEFVGFTPGAISLIAGRPSHGKTTLMFNILLEMSYLYPGKSFYFFTYEEPVRNLSIKLLNRLTATNLRENFRSDLAKPTNYEFLKAYIKEGRTDIAEVEEGKRKLQELVDSQRIRVIDRNYSVEELSSLMAYLNKRENIGGVFIDYIQRMRTERRTQDKRTEIAHISDQVLQIAKENNLPIILGSQLNRATMSSANKKPSLENLKEAGNLEEDANTVLSVYNESREKAEDPEGATYEDRREVTLEIKALKNREGEVNKTALLSFDKYTGVIAEVKQEGALTGW